MVHVCYKIDNTKCGAAVNTNRMVHLVAETREHILDVATELLSAKGFFDVTMKDIANVAGVSRTSLYRYYLDKLDVGIAVSERLVAQADSRWQQFVKETRSTSTNALEEISTWIETLWLNGEVDAQERFFAEFDAYFSGSRLPSDFNERWGGVPLRGQLLRDVVATIERGMQDGSIRSDIDPAIAAGALANALRGLKHRLLLRSEALIELQGIDHQTAIKTAVDIILDGLKPRN